MPKNMIVSSQSVSTTRLLKESPYYTSKTSAAAQQVFAHLTFNQNQVVQDLLSSSKRSSR